MKRRILEFTIVIIALISIAYWIYDQHFSTTSLTPLSLTNPPQPSQQEYWYGIYYDNQKVGYLGSRISPINDKQIEVHTENLLRLVTMSVIQTIRIAGSAIVDNAGFLQTFHFSYSAGPASADIKGHVQGKTVHISITSPHATRDMAIPVQEIPRFPLYLRHSIIKHFKKDRKQFVANTFDPMSFSDRKIHYLIKGIQTIRLQDGSSLNALLVEEQSPDIGISSTVYLHPQLGYPIKEVSQLGFISELEPKEKAITNITDAPIDMIDNFSLKPPAQQVTHLATAKQGLGLQEQGQSPLHLLNLRIKHTPKEIDTDSLRGGRQKLTKNLLSIQLEDLKKHNHITYPLSSISVTLKEYLQSTAFMDLEDTKLKNAAQKVLKQASSTTALSIVKALAQFVHDHVEDNFVASIPSAVDVLETAQGDCNEHTILFVALCRSLGIPARQVAGLAFMGESSSGIQPAFYYHAWAEVYINGWLSVDPTWGQIPADVTHVRLAIGDITKQAHLTSLFGQIGLEVVTSE